MAHAQVYHIPEETISQFFHHAVQNLDKNGKIIETLAYLVGYEEHSILVGSELIFPDQSATSSYVDDNGKYLRSLPPVPNFMNILSNF